MDTTHPIRIGLVGCGWHGSTLAKAVQRTNALRLVAAADPDVDAATGVAALAEAVSVHRSVEELLASADVDAVVIATPHDLLAPVALTAIRSGKHVLVEKPMALTAHQAGEVEFAAASAGVVCLVGYSFRYGMGRAVHDALSTGTVGELVAITGAIHLSGLDDGWFARVESGGGALLYVGCHLVDLVLWLMDGDPTSVSALITRRDDGGVDDTSVIQLGFSGHRVAQLLVSQAGPGFGYDLQVIGRTGSITLRGHDFVDYEVVVQGGAAAGHREPVVDRPGAGREAIDSLFVPELTDFAEAIEHGRTAGITASDGRRVLEVLDAALESAGQKIPARTRVSSRI